jgi:cellulose synthase/poly-beta-1,6-N-acetylglucosamine synthase-like glycosyltransferase
MSALWTGIQIVILGFNILILLYFAMLNLYYLTLSIMSSVQLIRFKVRRMGRFREMKNNPLLPTVSILSPAYNEEPTIVESVKSQLNVDYPKLEVIVINDGSKDKTIDELKRAFKLVESKRKTKNILETQQVTTVYRSRRHENLFVLDKENGGKADALNAGINFSKSELFCGIDADSLLEKNSLIRLVEEYMTGGENVVALGGIVRIANDCTIKDGEVLKVRVPRKIVPGLQVVEYIRAFLCGRSGFNLINALLIISGAFGLFNKDAVIEAGGYNHDTVGEDMELVVRLHKVMRQQKKPYKVSFVPDPICWTQAPDTLKVLSRQRNRWQRGLLESIFMNKEMILNPKYGPVGMIAVPFFLIFEGFGPFFEVGGYIIMIISLFAGWINLTFFLVFLFLAVIFGVILTMFALILEELTVKKYSDPSDLGRLLMLGLIENFGYRQLVTLWRVQGLWDYLNRKKKWGSMIRKKFS